MSKSDFFSFITSLRPIELKAIGELSQTVHLEDAITVYQGGEESDAIYIINRGTLEVVHESSGYASNTPVSYLSRGDMFGETETLSGIPRKNTIRSCEPVSIQRFKKKRFSGTHSPSAGLFLLPEPADRQPDDQDHRSGLRAEQLPGTQRQPGELRHGDDLPDDPQLYPDGRIVHRGRRQGGRWRSFVSRRARRNSATITTWWARRPSGNFSCTKNSAGRSRSPSWSRRNSRPTTRRRSGATPTDLLITALQYRDEFKQLMEEIPRSHPAVAAREAQSRLDRPGPRRSAARGRGDLADVLQFVDLAGGALPEAAFLRAKVLQDGRAPAGDRAFFAL